MAKKPVPPKRPHSTTNRPVAAPLIGMSQTGLRSVLEQYQHWRKTCPLDIRLAELLWSPEGMWPEVPIPIIQVPNKQRDRTVAQKVGEAFWWNRKMNRQKQHGDGHLKDRTKIQGKALATCRTVVYAPLLKAQGRADRSGDDHGPRLTLLKERCEKLWHQFQETVCEIGERFRDEYWLDLRSRDLQDQIREYRDRVKAAAVLPALFARHQRFIQGHLGPVCDPDAQEYVAALARVIELWPRVKPRLDFSAVLPEEASYRGQKEGRPWPPVTNCKKALQALRPRIPATAIDQLLMAWCVKPYSG